jgi:Flp pilus assembly pilin Flp
MNKLSVSMMTLYYFVNAKIEDRKETGAVAIEYVLLAVGIALIMTVGAALLGARIDAKFDTIIP